MCSPRLLKVEYTWCVCRERLVIVEIVVFIFEVMTLQRNLYHPLNSSKIQQAENINNAIEINKKVLIVGRENKFCNECESRQLVFFLPQPSSFSVRQNIRDRSEDILVQYFMIKIFFKMNFLVLQSPHTYFLIFDDISYFCSSFSLLLKSLSQNVLQCHL